MSGTLQTLVPFAADSNLVCLALNPVRNRDLSGTNACVRRLCTTNYAPTTPAAPTLMLHCNSSGGYPDPNAVALRSAHGFPHWTPT